MRAAIDLGSNSALLTVMDSHDQVVHDEARVVGLGRGIQDGEPFAPDRIEAALAALIDYAAIASQHGVAPADVGAVATSAARRATDSHAFFDRVEAVTGLRFRIIDGEEEARLTFLGALGGLNLHSSVLVIDLGGGSTELATGAGCPSWTHSYEIGSVRLTEAVLGEEVRIAADTDLAEMAKRVERVLSFPPIRGDVSAVVGVAGTATTLAAAVHGVLNWSPGCVHGSTLTDHDLAEIQERLVGATAAERRACFPMGADRADFLLAGATILRGALRHAAIPQMRVSERGLRFGILAERFSSR